MDQNRQLSQTSDQSVFSFICQLRKLAKYINFLNIFGPEQIQTTKVVRIVGMVLLFITKLRKKTMGNVYDNGLLKQFKFPRINTWSPKGNTHLPFICQEGLVIELSEEVFVN